MSGFFDKVKSGAGKVAFEADKVADAKKVELDIGNLKKQIDTQYTRLGAMSYQRFRATNQEAPEFADVCNGIVAIEQKIAAKQEELKAINARQWQAPQPQQPQQYSAPPTSYAPPPSYSPPPQQYSAPPPPPPPQGGKFCPSCGQPVGDATKFCSNCGSKVA